MLYRTSWREVSNNGHTFVGVFISFFSTFMYQSIVSFSHQATAGWVCELYQWSGDAFVVWCNQICLPRSRCGCLAGTNRTHGRGDKFRKDPRGPVLQARASYVARTSTVAEFGMSSYPLEPHTNGFLGTHKLDESLTPDSTQILVAKLCPSWQITWSHFEAIIVLNTHRYFESLQKPKNPRCSSERPHWKIELDRSKSYVTSINLPVAFQVSELLARTPSNGWFFS